MLLAELWVAHPLSISLKVIGLDANLLGHFGIGRNDRAKRQHQLFDFPLVEKTSLVDLYPGSLVDLVVWVKPPCEFPEVLARMEQANKAFGQLYRLTIQFTEMLRKRQVEQLRPWLNAAKASDLRELQSLAEGMERDYAAIEAALRLPYSTGPVEGNINRLKLIKRSGYGRAGFDLLRLRVLQG